MVFIFITYISDIKIKGEKSEQIKLVNVGKIPDSRINGIIRYSIMDLEIRKLLNKAEFIEITTEG